MNFYFNGGTKVTMGNGRYSGNMATRVRADESGGAPSLLELKQCLLLSYLQCSERGLVFSANWYKNHHPAVKFSMNSFIFCYDRFLTGQLNWPTALRLVIKWPYRSWSTLQSFCASSPPTGWASHCLTWGSIAEQLTPSGSAHPVRPSS